MSQCPRCKTELPYDALFCHLCGFSLGKGKHSRKRANGAGSVYKRRNGQYIATITLGYAIDPDGTMHRKTKSRVFDRRKDAVAALAEMKQEKRRDIPTLRQLYDRWLPTHKADKKTIGCYTAAFKHFRDVESMRLDSITIEDLQESIDESGCGRRTQENMRTCLSLMYKYAIPRHLIPDDLNLAHYLHVSGESAAPRESFTDVQIEMIRKVGTEESKDVLMMIYLGFRPSEYLALTADSFDAETGAFIGGAKTDAGRDRTVTVSPKIRHLVDERVSRGGYISGKRWTLKAFTEKVFYKALEQAGIDNPIITVAGDTPRHKYTPHSCRHTFATLMKRAAGSDKDKLALIGHTSDEQLRDYQGVAIEDLRKITDAI